MDGRTLKMLKKIALLSVVFASTLQAHAYDKNQTVLDQDFWGTWSVFNAANNCSESYQFIKPGQFKYSSQAKIMSGSFAVMRNQDSNALDILTMKITADNKKASCADAAIDLNNQTLSLGLKWVSKSTAQICADVEAKQCSPLYLIKQK